MATSSYIDGVLVFKCKCGTIGPRVLFEGARLDEKPARCKKCAAARSKKYRKNSPRWSEYSRNHYIQERKTNFKRRIYLSLGKRKSTAEKRGLEFCLTPEDIVEILKKQDGKCILTDRKLVINGIGKVSPDTMSIDRIDQSIGYIPENVRLVTWQANMARGPFSDEQLYAFCESVLEARNVRKR